MLAKQRTWSSCERIPKNVLKTTKIREYVPSTVMSAKSPTTTGMRSPPGLALSFSSILRDVIDAMNCEPLLCEGYRDPSRSDTKLEDGATGGQCREEFHGDISVLWCTRHLVVDVRDAVAVSRDLVGRHWLHIRSPLSASGVVQRRARGRSRPCRRIGNINTLRRRPPHSWSSSSRHNFPSSDTGRLRSRRQHQFLTI